MPGENLYVAIVRRYEQISGVAVQPEYHVGPMSDTQMHLFEDHFEENYGNVYYVDEVVELFDPNQLKQMI